MRKFFSIHHLLGVLIGVALFCAPPAFSASTFTAEQAGSFNLFQPRGGEAASIVSTFEVGTALVINDVLQMVKVPRDCTVTDVILVVDDLDTGTTITLGVGYGGNPDYFIVASTVGQDGGLARADAVTAFPLELSANDTIDVLVVAAPTGGGVGTVTLVVDYVATR
jgi:hypothetical protein